MFNFATMIDTGVPVMFLGMGTVFAVLIILWAMLEVFRLVFHELPKAKERKKARLAAMQNPPTAQQAKVDEEEQLLTVLTAAIACCCDGNKFRIRSYRRVDGPASSWSRAAERTGL